MDRRYDEWIDIVWELLRCPSEALPHDVLLRRLTDSFQTATSWHHVDLPRGIVRFEVNGVPPGWPPPADQEFLHQAMPTHPLFRWFQQSGDTMAMSLGRVPPGVAPPQAFALLREYHHPVGLDQQLIMPTASSPGGALDAFMLAQTGEDFSDRELLLARRLQPLLSLLGRQCAVVASTSSAAGAAVGLTGRELAVLQLLNEGLTALAIAHRLGISVRTVHKHLEHAYRKLQASDRLSAIRAAMDAGVLHPPTVLDAAARASVSSPGSSGVESAVS